MTGAYYTAGDGHVLHHSGAKLTAPMALVALGKHLATTKNPMASPAEIDVARTCVDEITAAMKASFPDRSEAPMSEETKPKARRGFAAMTPEKRREIARKGGGAVPAEKRAYAKNRELAASAGRKGGEVSRGGGRRIAGGAG